jgi:hypothetical protein
MLFNPPDFSPVFPWVRAALRFPFNTPSYGFPPEYFIEPTVGVLFLAPFLLGIFLIRPPAGVRMILWTILASSTAILLFITATGFTSNRYEIDFLPLAVLAAVAGFGIQIARTAGLRRAMLKALFAVTVTFSAVANLALGIVGPYDEMLKSHTARYLRIAHWFSPIKQFRPILKPNLDVSFTAVFASQPDGFQEPLLTLGYQSYRHFISVEHKGGKLRIISRSDTSTVAQDVPDPGLKPVELRVIYSPKSAKMTIALNGQPSLTHDVAALVTAPAQVTVGENRIEFNVAVRRFTGRIYGVTVLCAADEDPRT